MFADTYLRKLRAEADARRAAHNNDPRAKLKAAILVWQNTLPPEAHERGLTLEDIRKSVPATPQQLGLALHELGWTRKRVWLSDGPFRRYWYPPC